MPDSPHRPTWPAAVLWDMDGTLVDTEPYWMDAETALIEAHGSTWSHEQALGLVGNDLVVSGRTIVEQTGIALSPEEVVERLLDAVVERVGASVPYRPGALDLLADLRRREVPCALVTMSYLRFAVPVLDDLPPGSFSAVVTGDQVTSGKPHPESYLAACELLGVDPTDTLAIEDSPTGAAAAQAAGCTTLVVPCHVEVPSAPGRLFRDSLIGLDATALALLAPTRR